MQGFGARAQEDVHDLGTVAFVALSVHKFLR